MANLVRPWQVRYVKDGKHVPKDTPGAKKVKERARKWYGQGIPGLPPKKRVPLASDKRVAQRMLDDLVTKGERGEAGLNDPYEVHNQRLLTEHLADFGSALRAKGDCEEHAALVEARLKALLAGCSFLVTADLSASAVMEWLAQRRQEGRPATALPVGQEQFTYEEATALLGLSRRALGGVVRRHALPATGYGKARRLPRASVEALQQRAGRGLSVQTTNYYLTHLKTFCRWLVRDGRMCDNPMAHLEGQSTATDRRHDRRELEADEFRAVLDATRSSTRSFRGLNGEDRFHLYALACGTGFRARALASLTPASFNLDSPVPTVTLAARKNKSKKQKVQPLPADVADLMRAFLKGKPAGQLLWGGTWARDHQGAEMLRIDLAAAGIPYQVPGPDGPLFADFHALRHTYLTLGGRAGIDLRTLQELAGHSTPVLTARYVHRRLHDLAGAVEKLPSVLPNPPSLPRAGASSA